MTNLILSEIEGYQWLENGQSVYSGRMLQLYNQLDVFFQQLAQKYQAKSYQFPTFIPLAEMSKIQYLENFPNLATFPVVLDLNESNLVQVVSGNRIEHSQIEPVSNILTPAACYHFYIHFQNQSLEKPLYLTTRCTCFRHETHYKPLQRQWQFNMREIVCIGTSDEVQIFLEDARSRLSQLFLKLQLPIEWDVATDPFFNPSKNPKYLMQRLEPVKHEMVYQQNLAIGSVNFHRNYFGEAFKIQRNTEDAFSGCVAFGLDRWIYVFLDTYGTNPANWPDLEGLLDE